jgi:hypothetical protein
MSRNPISRKEIVMEAKAVEMKFEGSKLVLALDPNKDGGPVLTLVLDLMEIPDEVMSLIAAKKAAK